MGLHRPPLMARVIFQLSPQRIKGIADRDWQIFICLAIDH